MRLLAALAVACVVFASTSEATYAAQSAVEELSAGAEMQPPGADMEEADVEGDRQTDHDAELKEREDEEEPCVRQRKTRSLRNRGAMTSSASPCRTRRTTRSRGLPRARCHLRVTWRRWRKRSRLQLRALSS